MRLPLNTFGSHVGVAVGLTVALTVALGVGVTEPPAVADGVAEGVTVADIVALGVGVGVVGQPRSCPRISPFGKVELWIFR